MVKIKGQTTLLHWAALACVCATAAGQEVAVKVDGSGFAIQDFVEGAKAFGNRAYVWTDLPERFRGWQFTQTLGGERARIEVVPQQDGTLYVATAPGQSGPSLGGWKKIPDATFHYTDKGRSMMVVYERPCKAGERVYVPQGNWVGVIALAPELERGETLEPDSPPVPGIVIDTTPDPMNVYVGCPGIAVLPDGTYVASHSFFGRGTTNNAMVVFASTDRGATWSKQADIDGQWWSSLFLHNGALYLMGTSGLYGNAVIRRSTDGGKTWTSPADAESGLLLDDGQYHCAPVPVVVHDGRIWRAMEDSRGPGGWGSHFRSFVMSAPADSDLLDAANWTCTNRLQFAPAWFQAENPGWLEGNIVVTPEGEVINFLRFNDDRGDRAAIVTISEDGRSASFDPATGFIDFPGGRSKFTIRFDPATKRYWSLVNKQCDPEAYRNILALTSSPDLRHWTVDSILLTHPDPANHAFQYVDWLFDGNDIIAASRTAWDGSHNAHDANYFTFHRFPDFCASLRSTDSRP